MYTIIHIGICHYILAYTIIYIGIYHYIVYTIIHIGCHPALRISIQLLDPQLLDVGVQKAAAAFHALLLLLAHA